MERENDRESSAEIERYREREYLDEDMWLEAAGERNWEFWMEGKGTY